MRNLKKIIFITIITLAISIFNNAYAGGGPPGPPGGGPGDPPCWPPPCVPIDGGISFLLLAGVAYGGKKVYDMSKDNKKAE